LLFTDFFVTGFFATVFFLGLAMGERLGFCLLGKGRRSRSGLCGVVG
jgi:hypothetical protein